MTTTSALPLPPVPPAPPARPAPDTLAAALVALDPLPEVVEAPEALARLRPTVFQWLAVLEAADIGELAGLTDDLRELAAALPASDAADEYDDVPDATGAPRPYRAALHRAGLSLERVAAWGRPAGISDGLLALGRHLAALSEQPTNR